MNASLFLIITCSVSTISFLCSLFSSLAFFSKKKNAEKQKTKSQTNSILLRMAVAAENAKTNHIKPDVSILRAGTLRYYKKAKLRQSLKRLSMDTQMFGLLDDHLDSAVRTDFSASIQEYLKKSNYFSASPNEKEEIVASLSKGIKKLSQDDVLQTATQHNETT